MKCRFGFILVFCCFTLFCSAQPDSCKVIITTPGYTNIYRYSLDEFSAQMASDFKKEGVTVSLQPENDSTSLLTLNISRKDYLFRISLSDKEYEGIIISLNECFTKISVNGCIVKAQSGVLMINLAYQAAKIGLSGFEFMGGIPGAIGGGIYMNAGAYKYDIASVVKSVTLLNEKHQVVTYTKEQMEFSYRHSICQDNRQLVVLEAEFELTSKDPNEIKAVLDKRKERRMATQPWNMPSAGSVFRNPEQKAAWQYIDECGLRGYEIGGAQVSPKHSNFIVNNGYASAKDIYDLIMLVQDKVYEKFNVRLKREVELVNWE